MNNYSYRFIIIRCLANFSAIEADKRGLTRKKRIIQRSKFAGLFLIPVLLLRLDLAMISSIIAGLVLLAVLSCIIAKQDKKPAKGVIFEHIFIAIVVILPTYFLGE
ncbi:MAG: hypothetical protein A2663_03595 [Candidatus Buchananbacteria bacterium RIFCSPHIGHO2_01_FULL_46_12]|uniref:Uncharacterized protein n=3 Tax=Candidatus Buchananiibacteriota TaxID=1817903 RepID=A0A1G1Y5X1_9BACT|nr:MAG: hypothetical protein A2663_03595 [Candidatus Buchananbacteria bacterium RIFCSPHIGHO2_01_FULL_46_12]OGY53937.1 MAG: hypothetical protein A3B15_02695 [Candidatus Buchananbacteria bacterium RIFCSPLOWO2_01_FULL_45_31]OGY57976.1 MAG: hypothetical protein A3H67_02010 [Candidatus Buchananbacteria bacterium RIFCSPLOWO2_02_FULL_46_11b]